MSEYEKKNNRGAVFINKVKDKPSQPDFIGTSLIDGKEKRVALWKNKSTDGAEYFTLIFSEPLTDEEKHSFRKADLPAQAPMKNTSSKSENIQHNSHHSNQTNSNGNNGGDKSKRSNSNTSVNPHYSNVATSNNNSSKSTYLNTENDDIHDLQEILGLDSDDDTPF